MSIKMLALPLFVLTVAGCTQYGLFSKKTTIEKALTTEQNAMAIAIAGLLPTELADPTTGTKAKRLDRNVNTPYSDFAPFRYADRLYFSTASIDKNGKPGVNHVFSSLMNSPAVLWPENSKEQGEHTAHTAMTADNRRIYYTYCKDVGQGKQRCEILTRERAFEGYWLPFKKLKVINIDGYTSTQPSIGFDYSLRKEVLYFVSDRPGGKGGLDIWYSPIEANGTLAPPVNLPFNSPQNDVTPFFYQQGRMLFFSSDRHGEGGLDIFRATKSSKGWSEIKALGAPYNSPNNDLYFTCHQWSGKSYFCSDRPGCNSGNPLQNCIGYDIFEAPLPIELKVSVMLANGSALLEDAVVNVLEMGTGTTVHAEDESQRQFSLLPGKHYLVTVAASGYSPESLNIETTAADVFSVIEKPVRLRQNAKLVVQTFNALDSLPLGGANFVFTSDNGSRHLTHQNDGTATEHSFVVAFGNNSKLEANKPGYKPAIVNFDAMTTIGPSAVLNVKVFLKPFAKLPIALYFDNDQPRWVQNPAETESKMTYDQTLQQYLERKPFFVEKYTAGLAQELYEIAHKKVIAFFDSEVEVGLRQLDELCSQIEPFLKKGYSLEMLAEGQASPLAASDYNQKLSARRISTVRNYLKSWRNGAIKSYLYSGKLVVRSTYPITGSATAIDLASPQNDRRELEFSPEASRMRKVIIQDVRLQGKKV